MNAQTNAGNEGTEQSRGSKSTPSLSTPKIIGTDVASTGIVLQYDLDVPSRTPVPGTVTVMAHGNPGALYASSADGKTTQLLDPVAIANDVKSVGMTRGQVVLTACNGGAAVFSPDMKQIVKNPSAQQLADALGKGFTVMANPWIHKGAAGTTFRETLSFFPPGGIWIPTRWTTFEAGRALSRGEVYGPMLQ